MMKRILALIAASTLGLFASAPLVRAQQTFPTPEAAASALVAAAKSGEKAKLLSVLGPAGDQLVESGDPVQDANGLRGFVSDYEARHSLNRLDDRSVQLVVGTQDWPLPIPIVRKKKTWFFDAAAGADELLDRRVGRNELLTIRTLLSADEAEKDYFERVKNGSGTGVYAQRFLSSEGEKDGLYWPVNAGEPPSPLGPLIDEAKDEGYPGTAADDGAPVPYHGYLYRVLTAQGANADGGAKSYLSGDDLTGGFAFIAWPAQYGNSGIMTFIEGPDGIVYQKDLGPDTAKIAAGMQAFDPDPSWAKIELTN